MKARAIFEATIESGQAVQLTNVDLRRGKAPGLPEGFVPPPMVEDLTFEEGRLEWTSPRGKETVRWR